MKPVMVRKLRRSWGAGLVLALLLAGCGDDKGSAGGIGNKVDDVVLERLDGTKERLDAYKGRVVVLNLWATWCAPCRKEMPALESLARRVDPAKMVVLGVSVDRERGLARAYLDENKLTFAGHFDAGGEGMRQAFRPRGYPETFIIDPKGILRERVLGAKEWDAPGMEAWLETFR
jgi:thiol-disulfide isomerase/thioredoxin